MAKFLGRMLLALAGGAIAALALPRIDFWFASIAAVALLHLAVRGLGFWKATLVGIPAGFVFYYGQSVWMTTYLGPVPLIALASLEGIILGVGLALAAAVWRWLSGHRKRLGTWYGPLVASWLPLIWVAREWFACHFPYGGYQWSQLGQSVASTPLANLAFWGGVPLVSLGVATAGVWLAVAFDLGLSSLKRLAITATTVLLLGALVLLTPLTQGLVLHHSAKRVTVVAVQGNAKAGLFANPAPGSILLKHLQVTQRYILAHPNQTTALMVWPENSADLSPFSFPLIKSEITSIAKRIGGSVLVGSVVQEGSKVFNEGLLYAPNDEPPQIYQKLRPVPFGEYVPDRAFFHALAPDLVDMIYRGYTAGTKIGVMNAGGIKVGNLICFEIGIDEITHNLVTHGATVITSQANNADFGHTDEAFQQEALVRLQAITTGRSLIHASTVATTEIISDRGERLATTSPFTPDYAAASIYQTTGLTPAMAAFGWVDLLSAAAAVLAILLLLDVATLRRISGKTQKQPIELDEIRGGDPLKALVIMPTYNEAENIANIAGGLLATVASVDLLIVDDNSPDGTGAIADSMAANDARVHVLHRTVKNGLGPAYLAGFSWGIERGYKYLIEMDADGSHRAVDLLKMLEVAPQNDLVIGSRWVKGGKVVNWPVSRQIISRTGNIYARVMLRTSIRDITAGFRIYRTSFLQQLSLNDVASAGYSFQVEMAWRCYKAKARIVEVPITFVERAVGYSKMSKKIVFEALWRVTQWAFKG